jgi:Ca-activated chloride channel family protein
METDKFYNGLFMSSPQLLVRLLRSEKTTGVRLPKNRAYRLPKSAWAWGLIFICLSGLCWSPPVQAGSGDPDSPSMADNRPVIRVSTNLVTVPVSVTDPAGHAVANLDLSDFRIEEDGRHEIISKIADAGRSPLQLALLFDVSGSVNSRFEFEQQAAIRFLEKVWKSGDSVSIITFSERAEIRLRGSQSLPEALRTLLSLQPTERATAFFDCVIEAAKLLKESATPETRQAEIVLSDGEDNRSDHSLADALREVQHSDTLFYSINPGGHSIRLNEISLKGQQDLASLATESGGTAFVSDSTNDLDEIFGRIATELRAQYLLSYYSSNPKFNGEFRRISVSMPGRPDLRLRARQGYYATQK